MNQPHKQAPTLLQWGCQMSVWILSLLAVGTFLALLTLKLTGRLDWAWIWVVSPVWILSAGFVLGFVILGMDEIRRKW